MKAPLWATREFRLFLFILVLAGGGLLVLVFEIVPAMSRKLPKSGAAGTEGFPPDEVDSKLPGDENLKQALENARDSTPIAQVDAAYTALLEYLSRLSRESLEAEAKPLDYRFFFQSPQTIRGRAVSVTAMFLDWKPVALDPKIGNVEFVYRVYLLDPSGTEGYIADLLESPPEGLKQETLVTIDGLFLKTGTYEAKKPHDAKNGTREAPLVLGRRMQLVKYEYQPGPFDTKAMTAGVAILSVALLCLTIWAYLHARKKPAARLASRPSLPPGPFARSWTRSSGRPPRMPFAPKKEPGAQHPRPHRSHVPEKTLSVSGAQRKVLFLGITVCGLVLAGMLGWLLYQRFGRNNTVVINFTAASTSLLDNATKARKDILEVEQMVWTGQKPLEEQDYELIRARLPALENAAEKLRDLIQAARGRDVVSADSEVGRVQSRLFEVQLWILDAGHVLDFERDSASPPGFYIPLYRALDRWHAAQKELAALDAEMTKTAPDKALALKTALEFVRDALAKLAERAKSDMDREDLAILHVPDLDALLEESRRVGEEITRVEKLLQPPGPTGN